jgi:hypothetical protein
MQKEKEEERKTVTHTKWFERLDLNEEIPFKD